MKNLYRWMLGALLALAGLPAWAVFSCTVTLNPADFKAIYNYFPAVTVQGTLNLNCTRDPNTDPRRPWVWIGLDQTTAGRNAPLEGGTGTINYEVYHGGATSGTWTNTGSVDNTSATAGAVREQLDFGGGGASSLTASFPIYMNIPWLQFRTVGVYSDTIPITLRDNNANGPIMSTGSMKVYISIPQSCRFSTPPSAINVTYPAFSATPIIGTSNFAVTCTQGTGYTIALDAARGVVPNVNLSYGAALTATSSTGTAVAQPYQVNVTLDAGQAGRCTAANCNGTDSRTITVTY